MYEFTLPMPPSVNRSKGVYRGRMIKSSLARSWEKEAWVSMLEQKIPKFNYLARLVIEYRYSFKDNRACDIANREKILTDFMQNYGLFGDDSQIDEMHLYRDPVGMNRVLIKVREIE